jgi:tetratricopeptide (TPR) repeat protein
MENYTEYIEAYFAGALGSEEKKEFENRINMDKNFAEEVAFYLSAKQLLREELINEKKDWFRQLADQNAALSIERKPATVRKMWVYRMAAAAAFIGIIFLAWYLFLPQPASPSQMADSYINSEFDTLPVRMGAQEDDIQTGIRVYNEGNYNDALQRFENTIRVDSTNYLPKLYAGIVYLRLGNYEKALEYFRRVATHSLFANPGTFYQAVTLLKRNKPGDKQHAKELLERVVHDDLEGRETAEEWLKKW